LSGIFIAGGADSGTEAAGTGSDCTGGGVKVGGITTGAVLYTTGISLSAGFNKYIAERTVTIIRKIAASRMYLLIETGVLFGDADSGSGIFVPQTGHLYFPFFRVCAISSELNSTLQF